MSKDVQSARGLRPVRRIPENVHPPADFPGYESTGLRHPKQPLVIIPQTLSELTAPAYPYGTFSEFKPGRVEGPDG